MNRNKKLIAALAALIVVAVGVWFFVLRPAPAAVSIDDAAAAAVTAVTQTSTPLDTAADPTNTTVDPTDSTGSASGTTAVVDPSTNEGISGTWTAMDGSFVGYRVEEELARVGFTTAVGRTTDVSASMEIDGTTVTAIAVEADLTGLQSDSDFRDRAIRTQALETNTFQTASFALSEPVDMGSLPEAGDTITADLIGDLTIHGVTNSVSIPIEGQLVDGSIVVVGSITIEFADYDIDPPSATAVLSVDEHGVMEFQLILLRS